MDNLKTRVISAAILAPLFVFLIYLGGIPFLFTSLLIIGISSWEFWRMYNKEQSNRSSAVLLIGLSILTGASRYFLDFTISEQIIKR